MPISIESFANNSTIVTTHDGSKILYQKDIPVAVKYTNDIVLLSYSSILTEGMSTFCVGAIRNYIPQEELETLVVGL
jgi:hypothetical protein